MKTSQKSYSIEIQKADHIPKPQNSAPLPTERTALLTPTCSLKESRSFAGPSQQTGGTNSLREIPSQTLSKRISRIFFPSGGDYDQEPYLLAAAGSGERVWYSNFTSIDWVHDSVKDSFRRKRIHGLNGLTGRCVILWDGLSGWVLCGVIGVFTALIAYIIDVSESVLFDLKEGYCSTKWTLDEKSCCRNASDHGICTDWTKWTDDDSPFKNGHFIYMAFALAFGLIAGALTLLTKTKPCTVDGDNMAVDLDGTNPTNFAGNSPVETKEAPKKVSYLAAGSGIPEVKTILSGFVIKEFLGVKTLFVKATGLIFSVASGMALGKEGPFVHIACCVGNILSRFVKKYNHNEGKRRELLSASCAAGVAVAFGAPIGGVLFSLEEVSYYFPSKTMWRSFFCATVAATTLKALNPHGTGTITLFQLNYEADWQMYDLLWFVLIGVFGGVYGALFCKFNMMWAKSFRSLKVIKNVPLLEVGLVSLLTAFFSYFNYFTKLSGTGLTRELLMACENNSKNVNLCPSSRVGVHSTISLLVKALIVKSILPIATFGIRAPAGIFIPTMVVGALAGRITGIGVEWLYQIFSLFEITQGDPAIYAAVGAAAALAGVTRMTVSLAVIMFELTGSLKCLIPFMISILVSKWTADGIEKDGIYDLCIKLNNYPYLDSKRSYIFTSSISEMVQSLEVEPYLYVLDISNSNEIKRKTLELKLAAMKQRGITDGGFPIISNGVLVGCIAAAEIAHVLDSCTFEEHEFFVLEQLDDNANLDSGYQQDYGDEVSSGNNSNDLSSFVDLVRNFVGSFCILTIIGSVDSKHYGTCGGSF